MPKIDNSVEIIRSYTPGCIGLITTLHAEYYAQFCDFGAAFESKVARELGDFCERFNPQIDALWLVTIDGHIEGSLVIDGAHAHDDGAHLRWFILSEQLRGSGVGRHLLLEAMAFVDSKDYQKTFLWTMRGLDAARHLYEDMGFCLVHEAAGEQWGKSVMEMRFERALR